MQYVIIARDYQDEKALERRLSARKDHLNVNDALRKEGKAICAAALLGDVGNMNGSVLIVDFPSDEELQQWLAKEPYILGKVWESVEILPCKVAPSFLHSNT
ncbi:YciI family protein [Candidatus Peregrinibacteria bacterium]|nr:MAG: YciI family protein [Candidatus Peregrinibacteria bacterium]